MDADGLPQPRVFLFDYGGVLAEEGFTAGLKAIAMANGLDPELFFERATEIIYASKYVTGKATAADYWRSVRKEFPIKGSDEELTNEILSRFILRPEMFAKVRAIRKQGMGVAILSDQTNWLDILDRRDGFLAEFNPVINSYYLGNTKRDPATFLEAARIIGISPGEIMFVDDNSGHIERAAVLGFQTHLFTTETDFGRALKIRAIKFEGEG